MTVMPSTTSLSEHANKILNLVKAIESCNGDKSTLHHAKVDLQKECDAVLLGACGPTEYTALIAESCHESASLHFVTTHDIADILGDGQKTVDELAEAAKVKKQFLGAALIAINGRGYFEEVGSVGSEIWKNNELSNVLKKSNAQGLYNAIGFIGDEAFRSVSNLGTAASTEKPLQAGDNAMNIAFDFHGPCWDWLCKPENVWRNKRIGAAMVELHHFSNANTVDGYSWSSLQSPVVDVGGGIGSLEMKLVQQPANKDVEFIIFDTPKTIAAAEQAWADKDSKQVKFIAGDFNDTNPATTTMPKEAPTYLIRHVLHDWNDEEVVSILSNVGKSMGAGSKLLICEIILHEFSTRFARTSSVQALAMLGGVERTLKQYTALLEKAGFKVDRFVEMPAIDGIIEASKV